MGPRRRIGGWSCAVAAACLCVLLLPPPAPAQLGAGLPVADTRDEAVRAIPVDELNEQAHAKLWRVVSNPAIYRRLPSQTVGCDPDLYVLLVRHPEVVVNIWQLMGITKVQVKRTGPYTFDTSDGAGTVSSVELVYGRPELHIFYAEGYYEGPLLHQRTNGACVLVLRSVYRQQAGRPQVTHTLDAFLRLDRSGAEIVAKTLQPIVGKAADANFVESTRFLGQVHQAAEMNGPGLQRLASKLTAVEPAVRERFAQCVGVAAERAQLRENHDQSPLETARQPQRGAPSASAPPPPPDGSPSLRR